MPRPGRKAGRPKEHPTERQASGLQRQGDLRPDHRRRLEGDDEGAEVEGQRRNPEEGRRAQVRGDVGGHTKHQARRHRREGQPAQALRARCWRSLPSKAPCLLGRTPRRAPDGQAQDRRQDRERAEARAPEAGLDVEQQIRLDRDRIGDQRQQASQIAGGVESIGFGRTLVPHGPGMPCLDQGRRRGERREGRTETASTPTSQSAG